LQSFSLLTVFLNFLAKECWQKDARKMLVKLTTGVNFINNFLTTFLFKSVLNSFSLVADCFCNFCQKNICAKAAHKMLVKLTIGRPVNNTLVDEWMKHKTEGYISQVGRE